jgi:hypothetical protein
MNATARSEVLSETDQVNHRRGNPGVDTVPQEDCPTEQTLPRNPAAPYAPDEGAFETFAGGAGI